MNSARKSLLTLIIESSSVDWKCDWAYFGLKASRVENGFLLRSESVTMVGSQWVGSEQKRSVGAISKPDDKES